MFAYDVSEWVPENFDRTLKNELAADLGNAGEKAMMMTMMVMMIKD